MVYEKIVHLLAEQFEIEADTISAETDVVDDLGADSLDVAEFLSYVEDEFGIIITADEAHNLRTVGELTEFIERLV